jgi:probable addiction module antidote protein
MDHELTMPSVGAWVLYFGYSLRDGLSLEYLQDSMGAPAGVTASTAADLINDAFKKSDIAGICHAIGAATRLYNISDLAEKSGLARSSLHRAFAGDPIKPNFTTVFNVLDAMGFQLQVTVRQGARARGARLRSDDVPPKT